MLHTGPRLSSRAHTGNCKTSGTAETARSAGEAHHRATVGLHLRLKGTVHGSGCHPHPRDFTPMSVSTDSDEFTIGAFLGTHQVAIDVVRDRDSVVGIDHYLTDRFRSNWLRTHRPRLVPSPNLNGTSPSGRLISRHFCYHYWRDPSIRTDFLASYDNERY